MDEANEVLTEVRTLRRRSRRLAHGGAWLPALVLAGLALLSLVLYRYPFSDPPPSTGVFSPDEVIWMARLPSPYWAGLPGDQRSQLASYLFWLVVEPLALVIVAWWYRQRERRHGVRVAWRVPIAAGLLGLAGMLALFAAPVGVPTDYMPRIIFWEGFLTPLLSVGIAAIALGVIERSWGIALSGLWMAGVAFQVCAFGLPGELFGWQVWLLSFGSGPAYGGTLGLGMTRVGPTLLAMVLPLLIVAGYRALRARAA